MKDINVVCLSGRLTRDPEIRVTQGGTSIACFGFAFNSSRKNAQGEWEDVPNFIECKVIGKRAESVARILTKGKKASIQGRLAYQSWEKDSQKRSKLELIVDEISFESAKTESSTKSAPSGYDSYDEDIPF